MSVWTTDPYHDAWESYLHTERMQLSERASGKMRRAIGKALEGESREELERRAAEDERMARAGLVKLKRANSVFYKHIDDLTPEDRLARIEAERDTVMRLRGRIETEKIAAQWREKGWHQPDAKITSERRRLPGTLVNKGNKKGQGPLRPRPDEHQPVCVGLFSTVPERAQAAAGCSSYRIGSTLRLSCHPR